MKQLAASVVAVLEREWAPTRRRSLYQWLCEEAYLDPTSARPGSLETLLSALGT